MRQLRSTYLVVTGKGMCEDLRGRNRGSRPAKARGRNLLGLLVQMKVPEEDGGWAMERLTFSVGASCPNCSLGLK